MSTKKTIQINPELFKLSGSKTRKNREKKELTLNPIVSPNNLKNKLLKRIKEHKTQEIKTKPVSPTTGGSRQNSYTDEFYGALDYLSDLTKKHKVTEVKQRDLNTRTLKNYQTPSNTSISLELPTELQESKTFIPQTNDVFNVNYKLDDIPYGCLKNGKKKTYREWKQMSNPNIQDIPDIVRPPTPPKKNVGMFFTSLQEGATQIKTPTNIESSNRLSREERLEQIKNKLKKIQDQDTQIKQQSIDDFKKLEKQYSTPLMSNPLDDLPDFDTKEVNSNTTSDIEEMIKEREENKEKEKTKKYLKKTVKRKFTLGKSDKLRRVSVLIKDRQTRKNIINTQKELKKTPITDVKKYLRQHGIIKVGSTCPSDILRKTFESAILTGEITNTNKETLLHNFLSGETGDK
jgi:hypothetical protein